MIKKEKDMTDFVCVGEWGGGGGAHMCVSVCEVNVTSAVARRRSIPGRKYVN